MIPAFAVILPMAIALRAEAHPLVDLGVYCKQLVSFFDYYGASRTENSNGRRNHARIGAEIDCKEGEHHEGIAAMIDLLERKRFTVLQPPTGLLQLPYRWSRGQRKRQLYRCSKNLLKLRKRAGRNGLAPP